MQFFDEIINTAMLGSGKKLPDTTLLPGELGRLAAQIQQQPVDREEQFLQTAALALNYRQCGITALKNKDASVNKAETEEKQYCSPAAIQSLNETLDTESPSLLHLWLTLCNQHNQIVTPVHIPVLLNLAVQNKKLRTSLLNVCGKRGQWLCQFTKPWNFAAAETPEQTWQTGALEQRKQVLAELRGSNPALAVKWLQQTWAQEDANTKAIFLEILATNTGQDDLPFLEGLTTEKSKKVRDQAVALLKTIPGSSIMQLYQQVLADSVVIKKEKTIFGLGGKKILQFQVPATVNEEVYKTGIEKLSPAKNIPDETFFLYQIISYVPPPFWEEHFNETPHEIVELFKKSDVGKELLPALGLAAGRFKNITWASKIIEDDTRIYLDLILLMPQNEQERYLTKYFDADPSGGINCAVRSAHEWGFQLTTKIMAHAAKNPYQYNKAFFSQHVHLIPPSIMPEIDTFAPAEEYMRNNWANTAAFVKRLLQIKENINQSFKP